MAYHGDIKQNAPIMHDEYDLIHSPLQQFYTEDDHTIEICIYRMPDTSWTLEVVDEYGNSTVWDDEFETDQAASDMVMNSICEDGIASLIGPPSHASGSRSTESASFQLAAPLDIEEMDSLGNFLMSDATSEETMWLDTLDGYLTAIVIGPSTLPLSQWYSGIWGKHEEDVPHFQTLEEAQHVMKMIMRHYNGIIWSLQRDAENHEPIFDVFVPEDRSRKYVDAEMWSAGFMEGLALCRVDWQPLFDDPQGVKWLDPIRLLGAEEVSEEEEWLVATPAQREEIAKRISSSVAAIYRFWLPCRQAIHELQLAKTFKREHQKVGRNDPCPCGSGKKFKKCCGVATTLH